MKSFAPFLFALLIAISPWRMTPSLTADDTTASAAAQDEASAAKKKKKDTVPRLAEMRIDEKTLSARSVNLPIPGSSRTVQDLLDKMSEWSEDDKIGGVLLDLGNIMLSMADVEELRGGIQQFQEADKKVWAYLNGGDPNAYLLACAADEIAVAPSGSTVIPGLGNLFTFMEGYHQLVGSEFQVITAGKYKYPGFLNRREPNEYFHEEFGCILDSMFGDYVQMIAAGRDLDEDKVRDLIDHGIFNAPQAQQNGLVDTLCYFDEYRERVLKREKMKCHRDTSDELKDLTSIQDIMEWMNDRMQEAVKAREAVGPKIAVLHARGPIVDVNLGAAFASQLICRDDFSKVVDELRKDKSIKAVVLRIDSPGGSGYASDIIWQHLRKLDEEKPLVVCMGRVAGSGGYYIACPGRKIFAQPTTITGSIGVLAILESQRSAFNRMDIEIAEMKRGKRATLGAPHRALDEEEVDLLQSYIDDFYDIFIDRVATTRQRPASEIREIAEGRIWSGRDAIEIGLVDELGGLHEAIEAAREYANIPASAELKILHYPRVGSLGELLDSFSPLASADAVEAYLKAGGVTDLSVQQQLSLFTDRIQPLCWMATPTLAIPRRANLLRSLLPSLPANLPLR